MSAFPRCELHNTNIVYDLPARCPMDRRNPVTALTEIHNATFQHSTEGDPHDAVVALAIYKTCSGCLDRLGGDLHVLAIRRKRGFDLG